MTKNEHLFKFLFVLTTVQNSYIVMEQVKKEAQKVKNERSRRTDEKKSVDFSSD